jgi:hypothetical protein
MTASPTGTAPGSSPTVRFSGIHQAMHLLAEAQRRAFTQGCPPWHRAIAWLKLRRAGLTAAGLLWLVSNGFVDHAEYPRDGEAVPPDGSADLLTITRSTRLVLTGPGRKFLDGCTLQPEDELPPVVPYWNQSLRRLHFGPHLVKVFKQPAPVQDLVFRAFEEDGWAARIDSPLTPGPDQDPKEHLSDTVEHLNRARKQRFIQFGGDGCEEGIVWYQCPLTIVDRDG